MGLMSWIFYLFLGFCFFIIITFVDFKYKLNKIQKIIFSVILLMITAGICFNYAIKYVDNIFLSYVFLMVFDMIYVSYFLEKDFFDKNDKNINYYIILVIIGFIVNQEFFNEVTTVFLTGND